MTRLNPIGPALEQIKPLGMLRDMGDPSGMYLVGGALRDALLGLRVEDVDFASETDPTPLARKFAESCAAHWFWLDEDRRQSRVLIDRGRPLTFDFAPLRSQDLPGDLAARDFTINSIALPLEAEAVNASLIDPLGGINDLAQSRLRMASAQAFVVDPLRILKGLRHAVNLAFVLEEDTCRAMVKHVWRLDRVAVERVRQEVWGIFSSPIADNGLSLLSSTGVGRHYWGAGFDLHLEEIQQTLKYCRRQWHILSGGSVSISAWLREAVEAGLTREILLLWTLTLAKIDPESPVATAEKWNLGRTAQARIRAVAGLSMETLRELKDVAPRARSLALWARKNSLDLIDAVLVAAVEAAAGINLEQILPLLEDAIDLCPEDLVSGHKLAKELGLTPGPKIGEALEAMRDAEIAGTVWDEVTALAYLRQRDPDL